MFSVSDCWLFIFQFRLQFEFLNDKETQQQIFFSVFPEKIGEGPGRKTLIYLNKQNQRFQREKQKHLHSFHQFFSFVLFPPCLMNCHFFIHHSGRCDFNSSFLLDDFFVCLQQKGNIDIHIIGLSSMMV